ncbi:class I mannose-6-phosphate isomerase [Sphingomonas aliaeris]|uniref:Class I mannose-6-phosphate isomerase n=1 Tax=Sphingomonas aliaeris TaxID=2759526 RepID=A0A974NUA3_9SPHN|nr:class I mannose-6-phosphate isomerase [Sphingomonas aliaeris]QQV76942.1 class I mannose-6-phosphate isomerase [Sphingomonas aliaeris]
MPATLLTTRRVEKPWGRHTLWPGFPDPAADAPPIGEIWFETPGEKQPDLLIKYLFPGEKLSVQVHPNDEQAHERGLPRGKDECWVVLAAEPGATIAIGTLEPMSKEELRAASLDGSIEHKLDWKPVKAGDFYYAPSDTIHAIGGGITVIEIQQNSDTTYRLYDYGSDRELHLKDGIEVANPNPYVAPSAPGRVADDRILLVEGPKFVLERWPGGDRTITLPEGKPGWFVPAVGEGVVDGVAFKAGECLLIEGTAHISAAVGSDLLFAYPGDTRI